VYIKGKGKLTDYPWLAKKALEKEGITKGRLFISESVSEIKYTRPNNLKKKVIAVYTSGKTGIASPNAYVLAASINLNRGRPFLRFPRKRFPYYRL